MFSYVTTFTTHESSGVGQSLQLPPVLRDNFYALTAMQLKAMAFYGGELKHLASRGGALITEFPC